MKKNCCFSHYINTKPIIFFIIFLQMEDLQATSYPLSINNNSAALTNGTAGAITASLVYVTPAGFDTKLVLVVLFVSFGILGLGGNILILYFVSKKNSVPFHQSSPFLRNFNLYMKSLAISDILACLISVPVVCAQLMFDIFQNGWPCKIVRYIAVVFNCITINNLMAISTERFLSTRDVPKTFSSSTVRKLVYAAWVTGSLIVFAPAATMNGVRHDISGKHYTVVCDKDTSYLPYRVIVAGFVLTQHVIPSIGLIFINVILAVRVWKRAKRTIDIQKDNAIRARVRSQQLKATYILILVTLAFVIPYSSLLYYAAFVVVFKPSLDFQDDFLIRYISAVLILSSSSINFIIYVVQMKDLRAFLKKVLCCKGDGNA